MTLAIRPPRSSDFFAWLSLYEGYAAFYEEPLTEQRALTLWSWLMDASHEVSGLVAVADDGSLLGLTHYRPFARPLETDHALFLDDLFVAPEARHQGVGAALIDAVRGLASDGGYAAVQWITGADNTTARSLYDRVATATPWVTYELETTRS